VAGAARLRLADLEVEPAASEVELTDAAATPVEGEPQRAAPALAALPRDKERLPVTRISALPHALLATLPSVRRRLETDRPPRATTRLPFLT
jgi:hypothetical protein